MWFTNIKRRGTQDIVGLAVGPQKLTLCVIAAGNNLRFAVSLPMTSAAWPQMLADLVRDQNLKGMPCHVVLNGEDYKLAPVETPDVPAAEIDQALLWSLRDVLEAPPQDMLVQSFAFASGINRPGRGMRHAVAVRKARIQTLVNGVLEAGLDLASIDIPELVLRNLVSRLPEDEKGICLVSQGPRNIVISLYRGGELYLARQLAGGANLDEAAHPLTAPRLAEQLGLDLLRTLDYYDSQLQQRTPATVLLQPLGGDTAALEQALTETVRLPVRQLRFDDFVRLSVPVDAALQADGLNALGAALRRAAP